MKQLDELHRWFTSLEQREQRVLTAGAIILLGVILYGAILEPFVHSKAALAEHISEQRTLLAWMRPATVQIQALGGNRPTALQPSALLATVNHEASSAGLGNALRQVQQQSDGSVRVQLEGAPFDTFLRWLGKLQQNYGVTVTDMNVQHGNDGNGLVDANLRLEVPAT